MLWSTTQSLLIIFPAVFGQLYYDSFTGSEINRTRYEEWSRYSLTPVCARAVTPCDPNEPRRMDLSCNNLHYPPRGTSLTPFTRLIPPVFGESGALRRSKSGNPLPLVRPLRVSLMTDGRRPHKRFSQMLTNYNVFLAGEVTSVHDTVNYVTYTRTCCQPAGEQNPRCLPLKVMEDDLHLRRSTVRCMNLTRAITYQTLGCVNNDVPLERVNLATPMLDLSMVYGNDEREARRGREGKGGRMRAEVIDGKEWPPSGGAVCVNNVPPNETRCHDSPNAGANSLLAINIIFLWFYRNHNAIADALKKQNPCWDDNKLYYAAREINIAYCNHIMYYEMLPELFGWEFLLRNKIVFDTTGHVDDYDPSLEPRLTIDYTVAIRWFHTLQEGTLNLYKADGRVYGSVQVVDLILRTGALARDGTLAGVTQGSFRDPTAAQDEVVDPDIGERVLGRLQFASDVLSSDMMKGRDFGLPPYNQYRKRCGLPEARDFKDLYGWMDRQQVLAMANSYEHPDDIDLFAALLAEKPMSGGELGPTLACIMAEQLLRWRRADRFWYEHSGQPGAFTTEQLREVRKMSLAKLLCQHGDSVAAVQPRPFLLPGEGNEITDCAKYDMPDLSVFRDERCYPNIARSRDGSHLTPKDSQYLIPRYDEYNLNGFTKLDINQYKPFVNFPNSIQGFSNIDLSKSILRYPNTYSDHADLLSQIDNTRLDRKNPTESEKNPRKNEGLKINLFPSKNPEVNIYPNADPVDPKTQIKTTSLPDYSNLNSKPRYQNLNYNLHPALGNVKHPFEEFLENYWQSSNGNPFKAFTN